MSVAAAAGGGGGMDGDDDKKRKRALPVDAPDPLSESSDDTDDESAPIEKPKGLSPHCPGKSKSFGDLTKLGNMRTEEIVKKEKTKYKKRRIQMHCKAGEAQKKLENTTGRLAAARLDLADEDTEEGEVVEDDDEKATDEEEEDAEKSKGGASGAQSDHSMPEAGSSGRDIAQTDDMTVELRRVQFTPADRDYFLYGGGGDSDDDDEDDFDDDYEDADEDDDEEYDDYDDDDDDDGDDDDGGDGGSGDDDPDGVVKKLARGELYFTREEVETLIGPAIESTFRVVVPGYDTYNAVFESRERNLRDRNVVSYRLAGPVWDDHMELYLRENEVIRSVHFMKDVDEDGKVLCNYV